MGVITSPLLVVPTTTNNAEDFSDVIWTDECLLKEKGRIGQPRKLKPRVHNIIG